MLNLAEAREWLEILHGDSPGSLNICSTLDWRGGFFFAKTEIDLALDYIEALDARGAEGIYLRATTLKTEPLTGRGGDDLSLMLPGLWADMDLAGPGHKTKGNLPASVTEAMAIIAESGLPEPSHWIHSGGGLYPWWLLRNAVEIDDTETFRALSSGWQKAIERASAKLGFTYGSGVGDLSRVLRIPGTVNRKAGLERPCTALEGHAWSGPVYELGDLINALDAATPAPLPPSRLEIKQTTGANGLRPGDDFECQVSWYDLLLPLGWQWIYKRGDKWHLRRPGKTTGTSATLSDVTGNLFIFSEECAPLESFRHYSKFRFYAVTEHGGNWTAAAKALGAKGYGSPLEPKSQSSGDRFLLDSVQATGSQSQGLGQQSQAVPNPTASDTPSPVNWDEEFSAPRLTAEQFLEEEFTLRGAGNLFARAFEDGFKYCYDTKNWWYWNRRIWCLDGERHEEASKVLIDIGTIAAREAEIAEEPFAKRLRTHVTKMANASSPNISRWARSDKRVRISCDELDSNSHLITVANGILDVPSQTLMPHDPRMLLTKQIPVAFDKEAEAPRWQAFLEQALPDAEIRDYLQRAMGHTLLGNAEQRALFLLHGPSGTGKSVFIRAMEQLFGDFAETATPATLNSSSKTATLTNDLNDLRGKRFVSISELDEGEVLNESLVKRLTGGDTAKSRGLWQENSKWRVQFTMWLATNNLPRLNSDDNAIWRRVKPIGFTQVAAHNGGEVLKLAEKIFAEEASGILNWVLDGVRKYQEQGLEDLDQITEAVEAYRKEVDIVEQFLADATENQLVTVSGGSEIQSARLYTIFTSWCQRNGVKGILAQRRFTPRVIRAGFVLKKTAAANVWVGIGNGSHGLLGSFP